MESNDRLAHIDLFSGIGGFSLAAGWAGFETVVFCEKDEFCQKVLKKHWPTVPIIPDIRDFDGTQWRGATLLTGGFPCQPFSVAGQRRGKDDDRHLWPEMLRVIKEARPRWVLAENVAGIVRMELDQVLADLEGADYTTGTTIIPACAKNAPHRRDRVWIIAYDGISQPMELSRGKQKRRDGTRNGGQGDAPDPTTQGLSESQEGKFRESLFDVERDDWQIPWLEVAARFCRVDDGLPSWVHSDRTKRLKALGNAIVPQVAYEIIKGIYRIENDKTT